MTSKEIRELSTEENPTRIKAVKKDIARISTILREDELAEA